MKGRKPFDFWIFMTVLALLTLGIIMVFSSSSAYAYYYFNGDSYFFLRSQLKYGLIGLAAMIFFMNFDYKKIGKYAPLILVVGLALLPLARIPGIGVNENGAWRWIQLGPLRFQPSELTKFSIIAFFSFSLAKRKDQLKYFWKGLFPYLFILLVVSVLLYFQHHFSATLIILMVGIIILFSAGAKIKHFVLMSVPAICAMTAAILTMDYARKRVLSFLNPFEDMLDTGYQAVQSLYAIGSGGLVGRGLGKSLQKFLYIPEPQNDFVFSVIAEELGFVGVTAIMLLFLVFIWRGLKVAMNAPDTFSSLMAVGITALISVQVLFNIAVVTSSVPPTGVPLPFFSAGGTALVVLLSEVGILLNISRYSNYERL